LKAGRLVERTREGRKEGRKDGRNGAVGVGARYNTRIWNL